MGSQVISIKTVFDRALELDSAGARQAYLDEACAEAPEFRHKVEALLKAYEEAGSFLEAPVSGLVATVDVPLTERPGTVIGPYKLMEQIGEGGMGLVFVAEQQQPVRRKVALKVIKPGMDTRQVVARFEAERQALALMDHPNIAKVLDGGETGSGRPYFVMELVKGVPITDYCDQNQVPVRERLELFLHVCQAVQHAHQKGIIHRDIKPSNVLIMSQDGTPVVKVIDFGVAKAIGQQLTDKTIYTQFSQLVGTPLYMSPEQAGQSGVDVDTRTDIYALGVLLYELLTGTTPFDKERLKDADYDEIRRIIREEEPPKPSTRISTLGQAATTVSANRKSEPKQLSRLFRGELDWIVMRALEKDRNRRYETANGLAMDVQRYLADEPVQACPPSVWYRLRKFAQRNRAALATMLLVAAALLTTVVVLVISNISIRREEKEKSEALAAKDAALEAVKREEKEKSEALLAKDAALEAANANRLKAEANLTLILAALDEVYITEAEKRLTAYRNEPNNHPELAQDPRPAQVDRDFLQKGLGFYEKLLQPGRAEPAARFQTGKAYRRVGVLQNELKEYDKAAEALEKAGSLLDGLAKEFPTEPQYRWELAQACRWQGLVWPNRKAPQRAEAAQAFRRAAALAEELAAQSRSNRDYRVHAGTCRFNAGGVLAALGRTSEAESEYLEGLKLWRQLEAEFPKDRWYRHELAFNLDSLGWLWEGVHQPEKAEPFFRQALAYHEKLVAEGATIDDSPLRLARTHQHLAQVLTRMGRLPEAEKAHREALAVLEKLDPKDVAALLGRAAAYKVLREYEKVLADCTKAIKLDPKSAPAHKDLGVALHHQKKLDEAIAEFRKAIELDPKFAPAHYDLGIALAEQKKLDEAVAEYRKAIDLDPKWSWPHNNLGVALADQKKLDEAIAEYRKAIDLDPTNAPAHNNLGVALAEQKKLDEAVAEYRKAIALEPDYAKAHCNLGNDLRVQGRLEEAIVECRKAIALDPKLAPAHNNLGVALAEQKKLDEAVAEFRKAIALDPKFADPHSNLGATLVDRGKLDEAVAEYQEAIRLKKDFFEAHYNLGLALHEQGKLAEAIAEYRKAIDLDPKRAEPHSSLGVALHDQGKLDEAFAEHRQAIALDPRLALAHDNLGVALYAQGKRAEAFAEFRQAIALDPKSAQAHDHLGSALLNQGKLDEAIAAYRKAIALKPEYALAHCNLCKVLLQQGEFHRGLEEARRGHELGSKRPGWRHPSAQWVRQCERLIELDGKLPGFLERKATPASAAERIELAVLCQLYRKQYAAAARFYEEAFSAERKLSEELNSHRYNAACAAALAGGGRGKDANNLDEKEKARLRGRALAWLRAELEAMGRLLDKGADATRLAVGAGTMLRHWQLDPDLAGVHGAEALARLPEAERPAWKKLWDDAAEVLARAQAETTPGKKSDAK
jgi:tetratricopeptide (TPR) repeat protein